MTFKLDFSFVFVRYIFNLFLHVSFIHFLTVNRSISFLCHLDIGITAMIGGVVHVVPLFISGA